MNRETLKQQYPERGLDGWLEAAFPFVRNALDMTLTAHANENEIAVGASKIGGCPDLPPDWAWPEHEGKAMALVAQINFAETQSADTEARLPEQGVLYVFYEIENEGWGYDPQDKNGFRVLFFDGDTDTLKRRSSPANLSEYGDFSAASVHFSARPNLPDYPSDLTDYEMSKQEANTLWAWRDKQEYSLANKLLGHADLIQNPMELECELVSNGVYCGHSSEELERKAKEHQPYAQDWVLLMQIDSNEDECGMLWGDCGRLYVWIKKDDLAQRRFENCWLILQCS